MPNIAVLASANSYYARRLALAAERLPDLEVRLAAFSELHTRMAGGQREVWAGEHRLDAMDAVLVRTMPPGSLEQVVFRMDGLWALESLGTPVINCPRAMEAAVDKFLALVRLQQAGLPAPPTHVCQTAEQAVVAFEALGRDVVVKPIFGGEGRGLCRVSDPDMAHRVFTALERVQAVLYVQPYLPHLGFDLRLLVLGERVWAIRRENPADWRTNLARGAIPRLHHASEAQVAVALRATRAVQADFAGVDLLPLRDGGEVVLEVNAVPGWRGVEAVYGVDIAEEFLRYAMGRIHSP